MYAAYRQVQIRSQATDSININETYGPGELDDITIIPSISISQGTPITTFTVSGNRASTYTTLSAKHYYYYQSGSSSFSPVLSTTPFSFTKTDDTFVGTIPNLRSGCIDLLSDTTYVASFCVAVTSQNGSNTNMSPQIPDTRLPYKYVSGTYQWGYSRPDGWLSGTRSYTDAYSILSSTLPFDKTITPYYETTGNFNPTNYYWTDTITNAAYNSHALNNIYVTSVPTINMTCANDWVMMGVFPQISFPATGTFSMTKANWITPPECVFYTYPVTHPISNFSELRNTYVRLIPYQGVTPTPTATPKPTSTPTPSAVPPTPTPTPKLYTIRTPNGGETLIVGQPYTISWTGTGLTSLRIDLYNYVNGVYKGFSYIALDVSAGTGSYTWIASKKGYTEGVYKISISGTTSSGAQQSDLSDSYFSIVDSPSSTPSLTPTNSPTSTVTPISAATNTPTSTVTPTSTPIPTVSSTKIHIYAAGTPYTGVYPTMELRINGQTVKRFTDIRGNPALRLFTRYTYTLPRALAPQDVLRVHYTNSSQADGNLKRKLRIDRVVIHNVTYQSEASTTYSTGTWSSSTNSCSRRYAKSEWLHCNGYFQYTIGL